MRIEFRLHARRQKRHRHVLMLHVLQVAHDFGRSQPVQRLDHMLRVRFVLPCDRPLLDRMLNITDGIFLIGHDFSSIMPRNLLAGSISNLSKNNTGGANRYLSGMSKNGAAFDDSENSDTSPSDVL